MFQTDEMMGGMMGAGGLIWLLALIALILSIAVPIKYLRS